MSPILPTLSIQDALPLLNGEDALHFEWPLETEDVTPEDNRTGAAKQARALIIRKIDLEKMITMDLGHLPIDAIAVPQAAVYLNPDPDGPYQTVDISRKLTRFFPSHFVAALYELQSLVNNSGIQAYVIGGLIRDLMLYQDKDLALRDVDITLVGDVMLCGEYIAAHSKNFFVDEYYPEFGTAKLRYKDTLDLDLAATRREIYDHCGALPTVTERGVSLAEDVTRRDFTVNALAFSINDLGKILDFTGGIEDIEQRKIRVLHPVSFFEDPSRILRALKFVARLDFTLSGCTERLMLKFLQYGESVYKGGGERIKFELKEFLSSPEGETKHAWLSRFTQYGCLKLINMHFPTERRRQFHETLPRVSSLLNKAQTELKPWLYDDFAWEIYLCFLFKSVSDEMYEESSHRLGLTRHERDVVEKFRQLYRKGILEELLEKSEDDISPIDIYKAYHHRPLATLTATMIASAMENPDTDLGEEHFETMLTTLHLYKRKLEQIKLELDGNFLLELGVPEGEQIGKVLKELLYAKLSGRLPDRMAEVRFVETKVEQLLESQELAVKTRHTEHPQNPDTVPANAEASEPHVNTSD